MDRTSHRLTAALHSLSWSLLGALGAPSRERHHEDWLVDPEAAVILAALLREQDARLFDEALAWAVANGELLSRARMKAVLSGWASLADTSGWRRLATSLSAATGSSWPGAHDDDGQVPRRERSPVSLTGQPPRLRLRLRAAVGVGARAEVLAAMLTRPQREFLASDLVVFTQMSKRNTAATLHSLARSGAVMRRDRGNKAFYRPVSHSAWAELFGPFPDLAVGWVPLLTSVWRLSAWFDGPRTGNTRVERIELRRVLHEAESEWHESGLMLPAQVAELGDHSDAALEGWVEMIEKLSRGARDAASHT
jgi:DNA-binding transcriptional ArsR family regulator